MVYVVVFLKLKSPVTNPQKGQCRGVGLRGVGSRYLYDHLHKARNVTANTSVFGRGRVSIRASRDMVWEDVAEEQLVVYL